MNTTALPTAIYLAAAAARTPAPGGLSYEEVTPLLHAHQEEVDPDGTGMFCDPDYATKMDAFLAQHGWTWENYGNRLCFQMVVDAKAARGELC